jgi:hypothetical protein
MGDFLPLCIFQKCSLDVKLHSIYPVYQQGKEIVVVYKAMSCNSSGFYGLYLRDNLMGFDIVELCRLAQTFIRNIGVN